ncbi:MAG: transcriptional regulator [Betaproteobacteria bacterium]|nr:transcriptional regulator [Betaproteobacteria bacterium]
MALLCASPLVLSQSPANVLGRIQQAAVMRNYQGTLMFSAGGVLSSTKLLHIGDGRDHYDRIETLDGQPRLQYRHNEEMLTLWPDSRLARWEQREPVAEFPALPASADPRALENYELHALESDRVAGHPADVLILKPRDPHRYAQRLWADHHTGLLLRNDVLGPGGEVLESSVFTDLQIGGKPSTDAVLGPMKRLAGYRVLRLRTERAQVEAEGWQLVRPVPGFGLVSCIKRPLADTGVPVLQSVFSDGLTHVSVFIERYDVQRHKQPLATGLGATHTLMSRHGDWWFTVVGEVPMATVQQFEAMFERRR